MNTKKLLDYIIREMDSVESFSNLNQKYYREHGSYYHIGRGWAKTTEQEYLEFEYYMGVVHVSEVDAIFDILELNEDQTARAHSAARALRRWHKDNDWQGTPSSDLIERLHNYIIG